MKGQKKTRKQMQWLEPFSSQSLSWFSWGGNWIFRCHSAAVLLCLALLLWGQPSFPWRCKKGVTAPQGRDLEGGKEVLAGVSPWLSLMLFYPQAGGL